MNKFIWIVFVTLFSSCVSQKKYDQLSHDKLLRELENFELKDSLKNQFTVNDSLAKALTRCGSSVVQLKGDTSALSELYKSLVSDYVRLSKSSSSDAQKLSQQMSKVGQLSQALAAKTELVAYEERTIDSLLKNLELRETKVADLENVLNQQEEAMQAIQYNLKSALLAFEENQDLTVEVKDGKVYVSMAEQLLFRSGSYEIDVQGQKALEALSQVLKDVDALINVEGHTDDVPLTAKGAVKTNWELSVLRATSIVRILQSEGVDPANVVASGRAEFQPKAEGKSKESRGVNRRTEIIVSPKLHELYEMIEEVENR